MMNAVTLQSSIIRQVKSSTKTRNLVDDLELSVVDVVPVDLAKPAMTLHV